MPKIDNILTTLGTNNSSQIATAVLAGFKMFFLPIATATDKAASPEQKTYTIIRDIIMEGLALVTYIGVTGQIQKHATAPICKAYFKDRAKKLEKLGLLTQDELNTLRNVDAKKIKMAGEDFLNRLALNRKKLPDEVTLYIEKLNGIVEKVAGKSEKTVKQSLENYVSDLKKNMPNAEVNAVANGVKKTVQKSIDVLNPLKVYQNTRIALSQLSVWVLAIAVIPPLCNAIIAPVMNKIGPRIDDFVGKKPVDKQSLEQQPLTIKPVAQPNISILKRSDVFASFHGAIVNYSTGMRV